ncbi:hypothetical protein BGZ99_001443 [Dissophora globulifera]|uniref:ABC transporter domain-containing protein n=1 Tax=Dissophora globulifera TaxID=979702 RepID=A0A9P6UY20_9FUNG|nr:hypothetical protein BGZ99_001443 [Dissophora globulifera]
MNRSNGALVIQRSEKAPLQFRPHCNECHNARYPRATMNPLRNMKAFAYGNEKHKCFGSSQEAFHTILTVVVQGFSTGPAQYNPQETLHIEAFAPKADHVCFWTGLPLSFDTHAAPISKFSLDRTTFVDGRALNYGSEDQTIVAASLFINCFFGARNPQQRAEYLNDIEQGWDEGVIWADHAIKTLNQGFDLEAEMKREWSKEWSDKWYTYVNSRATRGKEHHIKWDKWEWRFFKETCAGRSLVTGQYIQGREAHIDRVFDDDTYTSRNCILIEGGLNFANMACLNSPPQKDSEEALSHPYNLHNIMDCGSIDGVDISTVGLTYLRQHLAIIPQEHTLFVETIRENLDHFDELEDAALWKALELAHLKDHIASLVGGLSFKMSQGGGNFSADQRSLICLAHALLRKTKVLILDEATAAVDVETDELIQKTIRTEFKDRTILTIAHRIKTIMDSDKILVLEKGKVEEFEAPQTLLQRPDLLFYKLAHQAGKIKHSDE